MTNEQPQGPLPTAFTAKQVVFGAGVVLLVTIALALYSSTRDDEYDAADNARGQMINTMIEACRRYDKPGETELDDACGFVLGDESPL